MGPGSQIGSEESDIIQRPPLWTEWLTDRCNNITLPQTSFAGGNNRLVPHLWGWRPSSEKSWISRWQVAQLQSRDEVSCYFFEEGDAWWHLLMLKPGMANKQLIWFPVCPLEFNRDYNLDNWPVRSSSNDFTSDFFCFPSFCSIWRILLRTLSIISTDRSRSMKVSKLSLRSNNTSSGSSGKQRYLQKYRQLQNGNKHKEITYGGFVDNQERTTAEVYIPYKSRDKAHIIGLWCDVSGLHAVCRFIHNSS